MSATVNASLFANYFGTRVLVTDDVEPAPAAGVAGPIASTPAATATATTSAGIATSAVVTAATSAASTPSAYAEGDGHRPQAVRTTAAPSLHIPGFTFPVAEHWLEDVLTMTGFLIEPGSQVKLRPALPKAAPDQQ